MRDSGDRRERPLESAAFETARVGGRRAPVPFVLLGSLAVLAAIVGVGVGGRGTPAATFAAPAAVASASARPSEAAPSETAPNPGPPTARAAPATPMPAVIATSGPGPIELSASRRAEGVFVHGDVFVPKVTWVYVSLRDALGRTASWASVSVPGAAGAAPGTGPSLRFDVDLAVPAGYDGPLALFANAYDSKGLLVGSTQLDLAVLVRPREQLEP